MQDKAKSYSGKKHRLALINLFAPAVVSALLLVSGLAYYFKNITLSLSLNIYIDLTAFLLLTGMTYYLAVLPLEYYSGFVLEHRYGLSNQAFKDWSGREAKKIVVSSIISAPIIFAVYTFIRYWPFHWWLFTAILWFSVSVLLAKFAPVLIVPLFYKYSPIKNNDLKDKLVDLAAKAGFKAEGVYEINISRDTKKANAAVIGLGKQKRIVLCDTLVRNFTEQEIVSVMGHELGHHKKRHTMKIMLFGGIVTFMTLFVTNTLFLALHNKFRPGTPLYDFESLVLIYLVISGLSVITVPLQNAFSRKLEEDADLFALKVAGDSAAFISAMRKLADQNLADTTPGRFYEIVLYSHPAISRRISFAESYGNNKNQGLS